MLRIRNEVGKPINRSTAMRHKTNIAAHAHATITRLYTQTQAYTCILVCKQACVVTIEVGVVLMTLLMDVAKNVAAFSAYTVVGSKH